MSLDLKKLANKLDEVLIKETTETLTKFLNDKRMSNNKQSMKLYTEEQVRLAMDFARGHNKMTDSQFIDLLIPIELPSDEEIENRYNKFIDTEIEFGFMKQEQGERLKWYYKTYFIDKIQGGNK